MKKILTGLFALVIASPLGAATVSLGQFFNATTNSSTYVIPSFTPASDDLLVVFAVVTGTADAGEMTDSQGGTWTQVTTATYSASAHKLWCFVRGSLSNGAALTITMDVTGDAGTGAVMYALRVAGMTRTGASAIVQSAIQSNQASGGTPAPSFAASAQTGNPTLGFVANSTNPATMTPPTSWTEDANGDKGYGTPTTGGETVWRNSGFTGTTITWGGTSASVFGDIIVELDASAAAASRRTMVIN